ncbi:hypothetical protein ACI65C_007520 [Semiaphis heraclei]
MCVCVCVPEKRNEKKRKSHVGERGKNLPQREKGGTTREKRRDGREYRKKERWGTSEQGNWKKNGRRIEDEEKTENHRSCQPGLDGSNSRPRPITAVQN